MKINNLTTEEKVNLLKQLIDDLDITVFGCYGSSAKIYSEDIYISTRDDDYYNLKAGETVEMGTDLCSG